MMLLSEELKTSRREYVSGNSRIASELRPYLMLQPVYKLLSC